MPPSASLRAGCAARRLWPATWLAPTTLRLALVLATTLLGGRAGAQAPQRPNIVFILADDLGYTDLGCYGNPFNQTPHIDSLARGGLRLTQAYAASPVCSPSRAAILTGKHPARLHLTNFLIGERTDATSPVDPAPWRPYLPASELTLAERLRALGYHTGMVGKWHLGGKDSLAPWGQGFQYTRMIGRNGMDYYHYGIWEDGYTREFVDNGTHYLTDKLTDYAVDYVRQRAGPREAGPREARPDQPFFLYLCYSAPHIMLVPRGDKVGTYLRRYERFGGRYNPYYAAMLESLDEGVGRVMAALKQHGLLANTLVIFTSDNGGVGLPELGPTPIDQSPWRKWKGFVYEGGIRIPAILHWPGRILAGQRSDAPVSHLDYVPTLLEWLGQSPAPTGTDGRSVAQLLSSAPGRPATLEHLDRPLFWHYPHFSNQLSKPAGAVRVGDWKLVESYETGALELFNLRDDPYETRNRTADQPDRTRQLAAQLRQWRTAVGANMPVKKPGKGNDQHR